MNTIKTVLVFDLQEGMGDMLISSPVMRCLKQHGVRRVDVIVYDFCVPILKANPYIDNIHFVKRGLFRLFLEAIRIRLRFFDKGHDLILQLNTSLKTNILMWIVGGKERLAYDYKHNGFLNTIRVPIPHRAHKGTISRVRQNLDLLEKGLGWKCENEEMIYDNNSPIPRTYLR